MNLIFLNFSAGRVLTDLRDKVDISVYFNTAAPEDQILRVQRSLQVMDDVKSVEYISREQALAKFKEKHQDNSVLMRSLDELGENPLQASLNIKTQSASQFGALVNFLESGTYKDAINKINYNQNKDLIAKFSDFIKNIQWAVWIITIILAFIAVMVTFNTVRLTIYNWRNEIGVMKLVGASNWYVRLPFLIEGVLYGAAAVIISFAIVYPLVYFFSPKISTFLSNVNLWQFLNVNIFKIFLFQLALGVILGAVSSYVAIRRYLDVWVFANPDSIGDSKFNKKAQKMTNPLFSGKVRVF